LHREFLLSEYSVANEWAMHGEDLSHRIFSFYVTLVTATLGGALAIGQGLSGTIQSALLVFGSACLILLFAGPVFFEALVRDHIRNIEYRYKMQQIHIKLLGLPNENVTKPKDAEEKAHLSIHNELLDPYHPSAIQHTLVSLINSLLVGASIPTLLWGIAGPGFRLHGSLFAGVIALALSFVLHRLVGRIIIRKYAPKIE